MMHLGQKHGVILTVEHVCYVAPYGRGDATGAVRATATHHIGNFVLGTLFRTAGSLGIRMYLVESRTWIPKCLGARSQSLQENPWTTARCRSAPSGTSSSVIETSSCPELRRASAMALPRCVVSRYATAWAESLEGAVSGHQSWALLCRCRCRPTSAEFAEAARIAWCGGRHKLARSAVREQGRSKTGLASLPHVKLSPMSALVLLAIGRNIWTPLSPSQELVREDACFEALNILTIKWATGDLPEECGFLLEYTAGVPEEGEGPPTSKQFDDDEWIRSLAEAQEATTDVPEDSVMYDQQDVDPKKVRPIQMGEFFRKYVSRRLWALSEGEVAALTTSMRQFGVSPPGGAEGLAINHQLLYDERATGALTEPLARTKVDEKIFLGMIEWKAVREATSRFLPKHTAAAAWKRRDVSHVEQEELPPMPKDRGAVAVGSLPWIGVNHHCRSSDSKRTTRPGCRNRQISSLTARKGLPVPMIRGTCCRKTEAWQNQWYMDDGDIMYNLGAAFSTGFRCRQRQSRS